MARGADGSGTMTATGGTTSTDTELARLRDELGDLTAKLQAMNHAERSAQRRAGRNTAWATVALAAVLLLVPSSAEALPGTGTVDSGDIKNGQVKNVDLAKNAVTSAKIKDGTVTTADVANGAVSNAKLANSAVTSAKIKDGSITTADLASNAVTSPKIADGTVSSADIQNGTIALADLASATVQGLRPSVLSRENHEGVSTSSAGQGAPVVTINNVPAGTYLVLYTGSSRVLNLASSTRQHNISCSLQTPVSSGTPGMNIFRFLAAGEESRDSVAFTGVTSFSTAGTVRVNCWSSSGGPFPEGPEISGSTLVLVPLSKSS